MVLQNCYRFLSLFGIIQNYIRFQLLFFFMPEKKENLFREMIASAASISDRNERSRKYKSIVGLLSQEAVRSNDILYIEKALKIAGMVTDDPSKAYVEIIRSITKMKRKDKYSFDETVKITERIDNDLDLSVALYEIALAFGKYGNDKKEKIIPDSLDIIQKIPLDTYRSMAYRNLSKSISDIDPGKALVLLNKSIEILENSKDIGTIYKISALCDTGAVLSLIGDERSHDFIRRAVEISDDIIDDLEKSAVLLKIVETEMAIGKKSKDTEMINEASVISKGIMKEYYKSLALNAL